MTQIVEMIELRQKRCSLRYGVGACEASGSVKCLNTFATCDFKTAYNRDGELRWFFHRAGDPAPYTADRPTTNEWHGPSIPILESVSTEQNRLNIGATRQGESPFGKIGTIKVNLSDFQFKAQFGDFYADERDIAGSIGSLFLAWVGEAVSQLELYWYRGEKGQTLAQMDQRRFDVVNLELPSGGTWSIEGMDPLHRALKEKAQYPRGTDLQLTEDIDDTTTTIVVSGREEDLSDQFGNTSTSYARINSEIISYTGYSGTAEAWTLSGVQRGALKTQADEHSAEDTAQRCAHFELERYFDMVRHILEDHTTVTADLIPYSTIWEPEGATYLGTLKGTGTLTEPRPAMEVCGMAMRDGMFSMWWDALDQQIKIKAMRQPQQTPKALNEAQHIIQSKIIRRPDDRLTRVRTSYGRGDPTESLDDATNYATTRIRIESTFEGDNYADGTVREREIYSPFMRSDANAILMQASWLQRYGKTPTYISFRVALKDADLGIGDVVTIESAEYIERDGSPLVTSWEIIQGPKEVETGLVFEYMAQSYVLFTRPSYIMANDAPDFATATDAEKENACYISDDDGFNEDGTIKGIMPDGSPPYVIQ